MHGSYDRKVIFFNLRSNKEEKYEFEFHSNTFTKDGWINVHDFLENPAIINELEQTPDDEMFKNAKKLHDIFKTNKNIRIEKLASDNLTDVANIFLLSNAGGVVLEPNDLIMATINAKWVTEPAKFTELINMIRGLGFGDKPKDLIIQSCYAVFLKDTGKTDGKTITKKFKTAEVIATLHQNIGKISASIVDVLTFVSKLDAVRKFKTAHYNPIFILIAYRYTHGHDVWNTNKDNAKKFLLTYLFSIDKPTQAIVRELLAYVTSVAGRNFDMEQIRTIFENNNRRFEFNPNALLDINISMSSNIAPLILYLIYYGQDIHGFNPETMTVKDHIFPQSALENIRDNRGRRVYSNNEVDSILNCELLTQDKNSNKHKGDQLPDVYFTNTNDFNGSDEELNNFLNLHAIPTRNPQQVNIWDIVYYIDFLNARKKLLIQRITANFGELVNDGDGVSKDERRLIRNLNKNISSSTSLTLDDD